MTDANALIDEYYGALGDGDITRVLALYLDGSEIVRYDGVANTADEMRQYFEQHLARNTSLRLNQIVDVRSADDVLMWDALVDTDQGVVQEFHVVILDDQGRISRHVPGMRGYWGGGE